MASAAASTSNSEVPAKRSREFTLMDAFQGFRVELDEHYDRRERIVKQSRDITASSKKAIFSTHRITNTPRAKVTKEVEAKLKELRAMFANVQKDVQGEDFWRYEKSISPGIQEYLEAVTFYHYVLHQTIPTLEQTQASLVAPRPPPPANAEVDAKVEASTTSTEVPRAAEETVTAGGSAPPAASPLVTITISDYLGGLADLTGEMMRLAIGSVGRSLAPTGTGASDSAGLASIDSIGHAVRELKTEMEPLVPYLKWLTKKMEVLEQSLGKIETASYNLKIRGAEMSPALLRDLASRDPVDLSRD